MPSPRPILVLLCLCGVALQAGHPAKQESRWVPDAWVARALALKADDDDAKAALVREFAKAHPRELIDEDTFLPCLEITEADLDGDGHPEVLLFVGYDRISETKTMFCVLQKVKHDWRIRHQELVTMHNEPPEMEVLRNGATAPIVMISSWEWWGTGTWMVVRRFYRFKDRMLRKVLEVIEDSNEAMPFQAIEGEAKTRDIRQSGEDLLITFNYSFGAGSALMQKAGLTDADLDPKHGLVLLEGEAQVRYRWDASRGAYALTPSPLNARQIECFKHPGDEASLLGSFHQDLLKAELAATGPRRAALRALLGLTP